MRRVAWSSLVQMAERPPPPSLSSKRKGRFYRRGQSVEERLEDEVEEEEIRTRMRQNAVVPYGRPTLDAGLRVLADMALRGGHIPRTLTVEELTDLGGSIPLAPVRLDPSVRAAMRERAEDRRQYLVHRGSEILEHARRERQRQVEMEAEEVKEIVNKAKLPAPLKKVVKAKVSAVARRIVNEAAAAGEAPPVGVRFAPPPLPPEDLREGSHRGGGPAVSAQFAGLRASGPRMENVKAASAAASRVADAVLSEVDMQNVVGAINRDITRRRRVQHISALENTARELEATKYTRTILNSAVPDVVMAEARNAADVEAWRRAPAARAAPYARGLAAGQRQRPLPPVPSLGGLMRDARMADPMVAQRAAMSRAEMALREVQRLRNLIEARARNRPTIEEIDRMDPRRVKVMLAEEASFRKALREAEAAAGIRPEPKSRTRQTEVAGKARVEPPGSPELAAERTPRRRAAAAAAGPTFRKQPARKERKKPSKSPKKASKSPKKKKAKSPKEKKPKKEPKAKKEKKEKAPRKLSAFNLFMKEEIPRVKRDHPDLSHREAFARAAQNWTKSGNKAAPKAKRPRKAAAPKKSPKKKASPKKRQRRAPAWDAGVASDPENVLAVGRTPLHTPMAGLAWPLDLKGLERRLKQLEERASPMVGEASEEERAKLERMRMHIKEGYLAAGKSEAVATRIANATVNKYKRANGITEAKKPKKKPAARKPRKAATPKSVREASEEERAKLARMRMGINEDFYQKQLSEAKKKSKKK